MNDVIATDRLFHYALASSDGIAPEILREGLRPLSDFPDSERRQRIERELPGYFEKLYADWAEQVIGSPYPGRSGVFLSPVDFRRLPGTLLHDRARLVVPLENIDVQWACLTYEGDGPRTCLPVTPATLAEAAARWPQDASAGGSAWIPRGCSSTCRRSWCTSRARCPCGPRNEARAAVITGRSPGAAG